MTGQNNEIQVSYYQLGGCLNLILLVATLGIANLLIKSAKKKWPARLDTQGVTLFNGQQCAWHDVQKVEHLTTDVNGTVAHKYVFHTERQTFDLPYERLVDQQMVLDFIRSHLHVDM